MQYCSLQNQTLLSPPDTSTTGRCFHFGSASSFLLELFFCSSPVAYWTSTNLGGSSLRLYLFAFSYCSWGSQGKNADVVCHFLLQWTTFCQNSPPRPVHLGWPYMAWLIVSLHSRFCICPPRGYFPVLCKFWRLCGGVDGDLPQEGSWHTQACCTRAPASAAAAQSPCHCWPGPPQEVLKHSSGLVSGGYGV